jgi:iron(III) transport system ATP-binding protein
MLLGDRIALLRHGRIAQIDTAAAIYKAPIDLSAARFFSPLSEIEAIVRNGAAMTPLGPVPAAGRREGDTVTVAIRPVGALDMTTTGQGVPGRIVSKRDAIGFDLCEVRVDGIEQPISIRQRSDKEFVAGCDVFLTLNPEHVLVFAKD